MFWSIWGQPKAHVPFASAAFVLHVTFSRSLEAQRRRGDSNAEDAAPRRRSSMFSFTAVEPKKCMFEMIPQKSQTPNPQTPTRPPFLPSKPEHQNSIAGFLYNIHMVFTEKMHQNAVLMMTAPILPPETLRTTVREP